ncbi:RHS repeat-associated core domain-containing protein [Streptomyces microflavus]|uniref:RHS repeat-associated core domain-containing protein n=1 Tax=Streptomyces microflavus TaxID=1919 RepID=UPI003B219578
MLLHGELFGVRRGARRPWLAVGVLVLALSAGAVSAEAVPPSPSSAPVSGQTAAPPVSRPSPQPAAEAEPDAPGPKEAKPGTHGPAAAVAGISNAVYAYDAVGRMVGVTDPAGETARYRFDAAGNRLAIERFSSGVLSVLSAVPVRAPAGAKLTLSGTGFSATAANNTVLFGDKAAAVVSATATRLVVTVPVGAANGKVSVKVGSANAQSPETFSLAPSGPVITQVTPNSAAPGAQIVLAGSGFSSVVTDNVVRFNGGMLGELVAATATSVTVKVPEGAKTGRLQVETPDGLATAATNFTVTPGSDDGTFEMTVQTSVTDETPPTVAVTTPNKQAQVLFDAEQGDDIGFGVSASTFDSTIVLRLYDPQGGQVGSATSLNKQGNWEARELAMGGTYSLVIDPVGATIGAATVTVSKASGGVLDLSAPTADTSLQRVGQEGHWTLAGTKGESLSVGIDATNMTRGTSMHVVLLGPDRQQVAQAYANGGSAIQLDIGALPSTDLYDLWLDPANTATGTARVTGSRYADAGQLSATGPGTELAITRPGQNGIAQFSAQLGQRVSLGVKAKDFPSYTSMKVIGPDGRALDGGFIAPSNSSSEWDSPVLAASGIYTLKLEPQQIGTGTMTMTLSTPTFSPELTRTGPAGTVTIDRAGQDAETTFQATAGDDLSLGSSGNTFTTSVFVTVFAPSGAKVIDSQSQSAGSTRTFVLENLPETGQYRVLIDPYQGAVGTLQLALSADVLSTLPVDGAAQPLAIARTGQRIRAQFQAPDAEFFGLALTDVALTTSGEARLVGPAGGTGTYLGYVPASTPVAFYLNSLTPGTTYTVVITPDQGGTGTAKAWLSTPVQAGSLSSGQPTAGGTITRPGQQLQFTYDAAAGAGAALVMSGNTLPGSSRIAHWAPGATTAANLGSMTGTGFDASLRAPLAAGKHKVLIQPNTPAQGNTTATLLPDVQAPPLTVNGGKKPATITTAGQNARYTFTGTQGQKLTLTLDTPPGPWKLSLWSPAGRWVYDATYMTTTTLSKDLTTLPEAGTYTLTVDPATASTGTYNLGLTTTPAATKTPTDRQTPPQTVSPEKKPTDKSVDAGIMPKGADTWQPGAANLQGRDWTTARGDAPKAPARLRAPPGTTALTGRVLRLDGKPLADVTVRVGSHRSHTDAQGRFLLAHISPESTTLVVDGASANTKQRHYGRFDIRIHPKPGRSIDLGFPIWLSPLDTKHTMSFAAPAKKDITLTTPQIPGLEVRIPKGSVVRDENGKTVTELGITAIPIDRSPFPLPKNGVVPVYFTVQPGGTYVFPKGAQIIYPNYTREAPGTRVEFMDYDPKEKGWHVYGYGRVSPDGRQVVPDAKTRVWAFHGAMFNIADLVPWDLTGLRDVIDWLEGDPVDLATGMLTDSKTDLGVADPHKSAEVNRTYWQGDTRKRAFGIGRDLSYNAFLHSEEQYTEVDLYLPGGQKIHYVRTTPGTGFDNAFFEPIDTPTGFRGSSIKVVNSQWELRFRDGSVWVFPLYSPLKEIRDRHGNALKLTRRNGNRGDLIRITAPQGGWIILEYDLEHRVRQARDNAGRTTSYTYDTAGRLSTVTDPANKVSSYTYDGTSNRIKTAKDARDITYMTNTFHPDGKLKDQVLTENQKYSFAYTQTGTGRITATDVTKPGGEVRRVEFNTAGYGVLDIAARGSSLERKTQYVRGPYNRIDAIIDPYQRRTELTYDANGYVTKTVEQAGTPNARASDTATFNGPFDQPTKITDRLGNDTLFDYFTNGDLRTVTDPEGRKTSFTYQPDGQITSATDPSQAVTEYTYRNGQLIAVKDAEGRISGQFTDAAGRLSALKDPAGSQTTVAYDKLNQTRKITDPLGQSTSFDYDDNGNLTTLTDARNNASTWAYDNADRPKSATDPLGAQASFEYDAAGYLNKATSRSGLVATTEHDLLGRTKNVKYGVNALGVAESTATYEYDALGLVKKVTDTQAGAQTFAYDTYERINTVTSPTGAVNYTYDAADRRETMTAGGATTTYGYDRSSILTSLTSQGRQVTFHLDATGREKSADIPGGFTRTTGIDKTGVIQSIAYTQGTKSIGQLAYTRDERGLQTGLTGSLANIALPAAETGAVFGKDNRITTYSGRSFTYDADGQLKNDGLRTYTWNARGQLTGLNRSGQNSTFGYEPLGTRNSKTVTGAQTKFLTDGSNPAVEQDSSGSAKATVAMSGLDEFLTRTEGAKTQVYLTDAQGSVLGLADADGTIATKYTYDPNGQPTTSGAASSNPYTFTGRENDGTGLLYYRARYYDPQTGRFISQDPIGQAGGINLYQYALASPTTYTDPTGNTPMAAACIAGGLVDGGLDWLGQRLSGRKVNWGQVGTSAATGCLFGMLGTGIGAKLAVPSMRKGCPSPNSFTGETTVVMADGSRKAIKDVEIGDEVLATDPETGESGPRKVTALIQSSGNKDLVDISIDRQGRSADNIVSATEGHPFWVADIQEWVDAGRLKPGQWLQTSSGTWVQITAVRAYDKTTKVYNLTVDDLHTYHVSEATALVHNSGGKGSCGSFGASDLDSIFDPVLGRDLKLPRPGGSSVDDAGKSQRGTEEAIEDAEDRKKGVASAPVTVQKVVDGPQAPGAHGPAEAVVAVSIVTVRGAQRVKLWWRERRRAGQ